MSPAAGPYGSATATGGAAYARAQAAGAKAVIKDLQAEPGKRPSGSALKVKFWRYRRLNFKECDHDGMELVRPPGGCMRLLALGLSLQLSFQR